MSADQRIAKFRRRAPSITSQSHLDKIIASFDPADRKLACESVIGILPAKLVAREDVVIEVKPKIAGQPNVTEATVARLNAQAAKIVEQADAMAEMEKTAKSQQSEIDRLTKELADLKTANARTI